MAYFSPENLPKTKLNLNVLANLNRYLPATTTNYPNPSSQPRQRKTRLRSRRASAAATRASTARTVRAITHIRATARAAYPSDRAFLVRRVRVPASPRAGGGPPQQSPRAHAPFSGGASHSPRWLVNGRRKLVPRRYSRARSAAATRDRAGQGSRGVVDVGGDVTRGPGTRARVRPTSSRLGDSVDGGRRDGGWDSGRDREQESRGRWD